ncbi:type III-A CRISPR-associated RAMP protein Csm5 [Phascolarctobacterium succinatutens]|jgi:CRISPR type III-A-associated RAMP protein Csm5|uniref:type III-A CRISPR-associated RAMP protein Csm5 n=1 Tax=Phascolarctobacterium succinatutens TaxID=626940 RepID=UPI0025F880E3|nr:type III-A CRISPR-associated RAMP protein Csm5 [Phascolarctobacterium succinatutens]
MNSKQFETAKMCLHVVTPINIADGVTLRAKDYLYDTRQRRVYFLNLHAWHWFVYKHKLLDKYEKYISNFKDMKSLLEWLQEQGYGLENLQDVISSEAQADASLVDAEKKTLHDINRHIRHGDGTPFIPGSSIKGVFRTAVLYKLLQKRQDIKSKYWRQIQGKISNNYLNPKRDFDGLAKDLESELLHTLRLKDDKERNISNKNAVCSAMRGLQVSDTYASRNVQTAILQKVDGGFDKFGKASPKKLPIFRECMLPEAELFFDVKIEKAVMNTIAINSVDDLLKATHSFFAAVTDLLQQAFGKEYQEAFQGVAAGNMFLGGNTGFLSKTLLAMVAPDKDTAKNTIKVLLDKSFKTHKHLLRDKIIAPRTLKCTNYNGKLMLMGVAEVRKV